MKNIILTLMLIYLCCCVFLYLEQRALLYFPSGKNDVAGVAPIMFKNEGVELNGWLVNPGLSQALLYYGGNAEYIEQNISLFEQNFQQHSIYLLPYRGYGYSTGKPTEAGLYSDALYVYDQLAKLHPKISLIGRSLGSGIATYVSAYREIDKLILVTPYDSIENMAQDIYWMFPVSFLLEDKYDSLERVPLIKAQTLVLIAEHDKIIPRNYSASLLAAFEQSTVESVIINGAGHNDISDHDQYSASIRKFLNSR